MSLEESTDEDMQRPVARARALKAKALGWESRLITLGLGLLACKTGKESGGHFLCRKL